MTDVRIYVCTLDFVEVTDMQVHSHYVCIHGYDVVVRAPSLEKSGQHAHEARHVVLFNKLTD